MRHSGGLLRFAFSLISYPTEAKHVSTTRTRFGRGVSRLVLLPKEEDNVDCEQFVQLSWRRDCNAANARCGTLDRNGAALHGVFGPFVLSFAHAFLDGRISDGDDGDRNQNQHRREQEPFGAVGGRGYPEIVLGDLPEREPEDERRWGAAELDHKIADETKDQRDDDVDEIGM